MRVSICLVIIQFKKGQIVARLTNTLLSGAYASQIVTPQLDIRQGGQNGYAPDLTQFVSNAAYVTKPGVAILLSAPTGFQYFANPEFYVGALKALWETMPKTITGFTRGLETDWVENAVSGGGEMQQDITNVTRARTQPVTTYIEKYGRPIQTFLEEWITNLGMDPDSKVPGIATLNGLSPTDMLPDMTTATVLFFEPDPTFTTVNKAWITTNLFPKTTGSIEAKRELASAQEGLEISIEWTGISQSSLGVRLFAQAVLDSINIANANPALNPAFVTGIDSTVAAQATGYAVGAQNLGASAVFNRT